MYWFWFLAMFYMDRELACSSSSDFLDCLSKVHSTPQHWCEVRRTVESEEADDPGNDEDWHWSQENFGSAEERQGCSNSLVRCRYRGISVVSSYHCNLGM
jgi:hypothetical protein